MPEIIHDVHRGSCLCTGICFTVQGMAEKVFSCYCSDCSKNAGGPYQICAKYPRSAVTIQEGKNLLKTWTITQTFSGFDKQKIFCGQCGCTLWTIPMHHGGDKYIVRTALLDGCPDFWKPETELFAELRPKFLSAIEMASGFETMPRK